MFKNVGEPINGNLDDFTFILMKSLRTGYFASIRENGLGYWRYL